MLLEWNSELERVRLKCPRNFKCNKLTSQTTSDAIVTVGSWICTSCSYLISKGYNNVICRDLE